MMTGGDDHANTTNEDVQPAGAAPAPLSPAAPHMVREPVARHTDVLAELDAVLDATPVYAHVCRPMRRTLVAAAAAEIRRQRLAAAVL